MPRLSARSLLLGGLALLAGLGLAERGVRAALERFVYPMDGAQWIWAPPAVVWEKGTAFYLARELELATVPATARLTIVADEEYELEVNGTLAGLGRHRAGAPADQYEVAPLLVAGRNRLVVELRSGRGLGAFQACLEGDGLRLVSDGDWRLYWRFRRSLTDVTRPLDGGARPFLWGEPPVGRWGVPWRAAPRPLFAASVVGPPQPPVAASVWRDDEGWVGVRATGRLPAGEPRLLLDWGRPVAGYLALRMARESVPLGLVYLAQEVPDPARLAPAASVLVPPGQRTWSDVEPRSFRYALVVGKLGLQGASVVPVDPLAAADRLARATAPNGVFGLQPPRLRTAAEDEVWGEIQGLEGSAGGEIR